MTRFSFSVRCSLLLLAFKVAVAQDTTGVGGLIGEVFDEASKPLSGISVCLGDTNRCATTDRLGRFQFEQLRASSYNLTIQRETGSRIEAGAIEVRAGIEAKATLLFPTAIQESVTVTAAASVAPEEVKTSGYLIEGSQVFKSAGTLQDIARYVQTLPGVAIGSNDFRNDIIVRGGSPLENLFIVDNVEIPNINTFANFASAGGTVSMIDPNIIRDATFLTGGFPSPYGNRASSVLQIGQREGDRERFHGRANVLFGGAGGMLEGPIRKGKGSWVVSARRSFLDLLTKDTGIGGVPVLTTFNGKASYDLSPKDRVWMVNLTGIDNIRLGLTEKNRNDTDEEVNNFDIRYSGNRSATGLNWQRLFGSRGVGLLGVSHSSASVTSTVKDLFRSGLPAGQVSVNDIIARSTPVFLENSREQESTIKYDLTVETGLLGRVQAGGNFKVFQIRYNVASPFGSDSPYSRTPGIAAFALDNSFVTTQGAAYVQTTKNMGRFNLTTGLRIDKYTYLERTRISPRAGLSYRLNDRLVWTGSYGQYFQQPFFLFLAAFGQNQGTIPFRADHYVTGLKYTPRTGLRLGVEIYRKDYKDYPVARTLPQLSLANLGDTFAVRNILFPLTSAGRGRSQGIEFLVEKTGPGKWFGQMNFALFTTRHAGLDGVRRPGSFDYPHIFNATGGYRLNRKWELASRFSYLGGRPYTPFDIALSTAQRRGIFDLTQVNARRLPDYIRLDVRVDRTYYLKNDRVLLVFLGVQNITNRRNIAGYQWLRRTSTADENRQQGIFPLAGIEWRF